MGKNKLKKFADVESFHCVLQYPRERLLAGAFPYKGKWNSGFFGRDGRIVLELGCGKGEYTVGLACANADDNHIGVDIKGARIWSGAKTVEEENIPNAAFLRTEIENIEAFFDADEVSEIWITFPDPQMQKTRKRLTSTRFLEMYRKFLKADGIVHLKTDSPFLYEYTRRLVALNALPVVADMSDLYGEGGMDAATAIKTYYESQWLSRGKRIKYLAFRLPSDSPALKEPPADDIERDDYRSVRGRSQQGM